MSGPSIDIDRVVREVLAELGAARGSGGARRKREGEAGMIEGWALQCPVQCPVAVAGSDASNRHQRSTIDNARRRRPRGHDGRTPRPAGVGAAGGGAAGGVGHAGRARRVAPPRNRPGICRLGRRIGRRQSGWSWPRRGRISIRRRWWPGWAARVSGSSGSNFGLPDCRHRPVGAGSVPARHAGRVAQPSRGGRLVSGEPAQRDSGRWRRRCPPVAAAAAAVGANLLVADPQAGSFFQLKQIVTEFARGGVRPCPEACARDWHKWRDIAGG